MKKLAITKVGFSSFPNAMHVELHTKILAYIDDRGADKLGLDTATVESYRASIAKEQDYVNFNYASSLTADIVKARSLRDSWYRYVRTTIDAAQNSPQASIVTACATLKLKLLDIYPTLSEMADGQNATAQIRGFVQTAKGDCAAQIELLHLTDAVERLETCNEDFAVKYKRRNTERAESVQAEMKTTRIQTDQLYRTLAYTLQGQALLVSADEEKQKVYDSASSVVASVGVLLGDWQYRLRISRGKNVTVAPSEGSDEENDAEVDNAEASNGAEDSVTSD